VGITATHMDTTEKRDGTNMVKDETTSTIQVFTTRL
jgi:hypothetical protein